MEGHSGSPVSDVGSSKRVGPSAMTASVEASGRGVRGASLGVLRGLLLEDKTPIRSDFPARSESAERLVAQILLLVGKG